MAHSERLAQLVKTNPAIAWLVGVGATALLYYELLLLCISISNKLLAYQQFLSHYEFHHYSKAM